MDYVASQVVGLVMSRLSSCSKSFPGECEGCPDYDERYPTLGMALSGCFGPYCGPFYIVKKCKRYNWKAFEEVK
jgi:hypothetical protein